MTSFLTKAKTSQISTSSDVNISTTGTKTITLDSNQINLNDTTIDSTGNISINGYIYIPPLSSSPSSTTHKLYTIGEEDLMWQDKNVLIEDDDVDVNNLTIAGTTTINGVTYTWPTSDGTSNGQVLGTDSDGTLSWINVGTSLSSLADTNITNLANNDLIMASDNNGTITWVNTKTLTGLTINNSTIGLTTPLAGTFTTLKANSLQILNSGNITVTGSITVDDDITISDDLTVTGDATINSILTVSGNTTLGGTVTLNSIEYTFPSSDGTSGYALTTNGSGTLSWSSVVISNLNSISDVNITSVSDNQILKYDNGTSKWVNSSTLNMTTVTATTLNGTLGTAAQTNITSLGNLTSLTVGTDGSGGDVTFYSATAGDSLLWDASEEKLVITGTDGQNALEIPDGNVNFTDNLSVGGTSTLTGNVTLGGNILDANGNELIKVTSTTSAVNEFTMANQATGSNPTLSATGNDTNIGLDFQAKGSGTYNFKSTSSTATQLVMYEDTDNGTNTITLAAPSAITSSITLTLPDGDGDSGQVLRTDGSGNLSWLTPSNGITMTNGADNRVVTSTNSGAINGEANLTFDGSTLALTGAATISTTLGITGAVTVGSDGSGSDVTFYSATSGDSFLWDASDKKLVITGTDGSNALEVPDGDVNFTDNLTVGGTLDVTGTASFTGNVSLSDSDNLYIGTGNDLTIIHDGTNTSATNTTGTFTIASTVNTANAIYLHANGGTSETIQIRADQGTGATSLNLVSDAGGITLNASSAVAITNSATFGGGYGSTGVTISAAGAIQANDALTVDGTSTLTGQVDIGGGYGSSGVTISTSGAIQADGALTVDSTSTLTGNVTFGGHIVADANEAKNIFTDVTSNTITIGGSSSTTAIGGGATVGGTLVVGTDGSGFDVTFHSATGSDNLLWDASDKKLVITGTDGSNALEVPDGDVNFTDNLTVGGTLDVTGAVSFSGNLSLADNDNLYIGTGNDLTIIHDGTNTSATNATGTFTIASTVNTANAIYLHVNGGTSETIQIRADQGTGATSLNLVSDAGGITLNANSAVAITNSCTIGGGYGSTGVTISAAGAIQANGALTVDGTSTLTGQVDIGGGYGSTGVTISAAGAIQADGALTVDSTSTLTGNVTFGGHIVADANEAKNIFTDVTSNTITIGGSGSTTAIGGGSTIGGTLVVGTDGSGFDVTFHSSTGSDNLLWDASEEKLVITGTNGQNALEVPDGNVNFTDNLTVGGTLGVTGVITASSNVDIEGYAAIGNGSALSANSGLIIDYDATYSGGVGQQLLVKGTVTGAANTNVYGVSIQPQSITAPTGTTAVVSSLHLKEPVVTATGTVTRATTLYVEDAPTEGDTGNYAIWVAAGETRLEGTLTVSDTVSLNGSSVTFGGNIVADTDENKSIFTDVTSQTITIGGSGSTTAIGGGATIGGTLVVGTDGSGFDVTFHSATGSDNLLWDASEEKLVITGTNGQTALEIADGDFLIADGDNIKIGSDGDLVLTHSGSAGSLTNGTGAFTIASTVNTANAIYLHANGGTSETVQIRTDQGTGATSINLVSDAGGITLNANSAVAITNSCTIGGTLGVTGGVTASSNVDIEGYAAIGNGSALNSNSGLIIDYDATYAGGVGQQLLVKGTVTGAASTNVYGASIEPEAVTVPLGTTTLVASLNVQEPNITANGTLTNGATVYIKDAPSEAGNNYALWVDDGAVKMDSTLDVESYMAIGNGSALSANSGLIIDYDTTYVGDVGQQILVKGTVTGAANTNVYGMSIQPESITVPTGTTAIVASLHVQEPNVTETGTLTTGATVYIKDAPSEGTNNYALWVDDGAVQFDSTLGVTGTATFIGQVDVGGGYGSSGVTISSSGAIQANGALTVDSTSTLTGDVTFGGHIVADTNENKSIFTDVTSNTITIGGSSSTTAVAGTLSVVSDITLYDTASEGNPSVSVGSSSSEALIIQSVYDTALTSLDKVTFTTKAASISGDKGKMEFYVDEALIYTVDDGAINLANGMAYEINGTSVLSNNTLGSGVTGSSLTSVGTISLGTWNGTAIATQYGGTGQDFSSSTGVMTLSTGVASVSSTLGASYGGTGQNFSSSTGLISVSSGTFSAVTDVTIYDTNTEGNPSISLGSSSSEAFVIQSVYDTALTSLDKVTFTTKAASTSTDKGKMEFYVDEVLTTTLADSGMNIYAGKSMRFYDSDSSNYVALSSPGTVSSDVTWTLPTGDGTGGQALKTDGLGALGWIDIPTMSNESDNRILTASGSNSGMNAEQYLTYDDFTFSVGADGTGKYVYFYSDTMSDYMYWDGASAKLTITGANGSTALEVADGDFLIADGDNIKLGTDGDLVLTHSGTAGSLTNSTGTLTITSATGSANSASTNTVLKTGTGGANSSGGATAGAGGTTTISTGNGGASDELSYAAGAGGATTVSTGTGGAHSANGTGGASGALTLSTGVGGASGSGTSGAGGALSITAGDGGDASGAGTGGAGGAITITAGAGGSHTGGTDGAGGNLTLNAGGGGTATSRGKLTLNSTANASDAIYLRANGGTSETIKIHADQGNGAGSINLVSDAGGITLNANSAVTITNSATFGGGYGSTGVTISAAGAIQANDALTIDGTSTLTGDVTFGGHIVADTDENKSIFTDVTSNTITIGGSGSTTAVAGTLSVVTDITLYDANNDGSPTISVGSTSAEALVIQSVYDSGAQTLDKVTFTTKASSATADKGKMEFAVDETTICNITDSGVGILGSNSLILYDSDSSHYAAIQAPSTISTNFTLILPDNDGGANQFLQTDGGGTLSWATGASIDSGDTDNYVMTGTGTGSIQGESNLTFDGSTLAVTGAATVSSTLGVTGVTTINENLIVDISNKNFTPNADGWVIHTDTLTFTDNSTSMSSTAAQDFHAHRFEAPTIAATNTTVTTTNSANVYINAAPSAGTNMTLTNAYALWVAGGTSRFSDTLLLDSPKNFTPQTDGIIMHVDESTYTDNVTASGTATSDFSGIYLDQPTVAASNAGITTTNAYTLHIANAPTNGTNMTLTNTYALYVASGKTRFNGAFDIGSDGVGATATFYGTTSGKSMVWSSDSDKLTVTGNSGSNALEIASGDILVYDTDNIKIGTGGDLLLTHDGSNSSITNNTGTLTISSVVDTANAIYLHTNSGTTETIQIRNNMGTSVMTDTNSDASLQLLSDAGGIGIRSTANLAGCIQIEADGGTSETIIIKADQGTNAASINLVSDAGGITLNANSAVAITNSATFGGGYGSTGVTISAAGAIQANDALTVDGTSTLTGQVDIGGGYGSTGVTISTSGAIQANGALTVDSTSTLTGNVTLGGTILDANGNEFIKITSTSSAVNEFTMANQASGSNPTISATGTDTNIGLDFQGKGTGTFNFKSTADTATKLVFYEDTDNGSNTITLAAPSAVTASITLTLPDGDGDADQVLKTDGSGTLSWVANGGLTLNNGSSNRIVTSDDTSTLNGEANLTFDGSTLALTGALTTTSTITVGSDGSGADVIFYSATAGDSLLWDASEEKLVITGTNGQTALEIADGNILIADSDEIQIGTGSDLKITHTGTASNITNSTGILTITSATGSANNPSTNTVLKTGTGGANSSGGATAGAGGTTTVSTGDGGTSDELSYAAGAGGANTVTTGAGGAHSANGTGGASGALTLSTGVGGATGTGTCGSGGALSITAGDGGDATSSGTGGAGGAITITAGAGGSHTGGTDGVGGNLTLNAGGGGTASSRGKLTLNSTADSTDSIYLHANGGTTETIKIHADQGTGATSINLVSDAGGITLNANNAVAITNTSSFGGNLTLQATTAPTIYFYEDTGNGSSYTALKAPSNLTNTVTLTLPDGDGNPNEYLQTNGSGVLGWGTGGSGVSLSSGDTDNYVMTGTGLGSIQGEANLTFDGSLLTVKNTTDSSSNQIAIFEGNTRVTPVNNDEAYISYKLYDSALSAHEAARFTWILEDVTSPTNQDGKIEFEVASAGSLTTVMTMNPSGMTSTGLVLDATKNVTPGDGAMFHLDTSTITDNSTATSGTATMFTQANFEGPTLAASNLTVTTTDAATLYIKDAPSAGTNMTITNAHALWVDSGNSRFDGDIRLYDGDASNYVGLKCPTIVSTDVTFTLPSADGNAGEVLKTDGVASLGWVPNGGTLKRTTMSGTTHSAGTDEVILAATNTSTQALTITLPTATTAGAGKIYYIKDEDNATTFSITINRSGSDTIDGNTSVTINTQYGAVTLYSDGSSKWFILSEK